MRRPHITQDLLSHLRGGEACLPAPHCPPRSTRDCRSHQPASPSRLSARPAPSRDVPFSSYCTSRCYLGSKAQSSRACALGWPLSSHPSCVALGSLLNLSAPPCLHLGSEDNNGAHLRLSSKGPTVLSSSWFNLHVPSSSEKLPLHG